MNKFVSVARSDYEQKFLGIKKEIVLLKEDLKWVKHPGTKRAIENQILQKQNRLSLLTEKDKTPAPAIT